MSESEIIKNLQAKMDQMEEENKQLKTQLAETQNFFNLLAENIPYPVFFKDAKGVYRFCNSAFADFNGRSKEDFLNHTALQSVENKKLAEVYHKADMDLMHEKGKQVYVSQVQDSKGNCMDVIFNKIAVLDDAQNVKGLLGFIIDITSHKELERELKNANEEYEALNEQYLEQINELYRKDELLQENALLFQQLAENTNDVLILRETDGSLKYVSPQMESFTGRPLQEMMSHPSLFSQCIHPEDIAGVMETMNQIKIKGERRFDYECRLMMPNGSVKWTWVRGFEVPGKSGNQDRDMLVFTDITARKNLERELEDYKSNLELIVADRTEELHILNEELLDSNDKIQKSNKELSFLNDQLNREVELRKKAQIQVQESEEKLRSFLEQSLDGIIIVDEMGEFTEWNHAAEQILGYKKNEVLNTPFWEFEFKVQGDPSISDDMEKIKQLGLENHKQLKDPVLFERKVICPDGKIVFLSISTFPIYTSTQKLIGRIVRDITQKKISDDEINQYRMHLEQLVEERAKNLKESEERFRQIVETSPMGMHFYKLEKNERLILTGANKAADKILGAEHASKFGKSIEEAFPPLAQTEVPAIYKRLARELDTWRKEQIDYKHEEIAGAFEVIAFHTAPNQMVVMFNDITSRIKSQESIKQSEKKFRNIFHNSIDMILIIDKENKIIDANQVVFQKLEYSKDEIIDHKYEQLASANFADLVSEHFLKLFQNQEVPDIEVEINTKRKKTIPIEVSAKLIEYENQEAILMIMRDLTERKDVERKVINAIIETEEKERSRLASDLHDEIGPLLSSIKMYLSTLNPQSDPEKIKHVLSQLNELVKGAVTSTREISNDISPHLLTNHGLHAAVYAAIYNITEFITVNFDSHVEGLRFPANIEIVYYRIINELINNTIKHAKATEIKIDLILKENVLFLKYSDNGVGFEHSEIPQGRSRGMGIYNLLSRVKSIKGTYKIETNRGNGFLFELLSLVD